MKRKEKLKAIMRCKLKKLQLKNESIHSRNTKLHKENKYLKRQKGVLCSKMFNKTKQLKLIKLQSTYYMRKVQKNEN